MLSFKLQVLLLKSIKEQNITLLQTFLAGSVFVWRFAFFRFSFKPPLLARTIFWVLISSLRATLDEVLGTSDHCRGWRHTEVKNGVGQTSGQSIVNCKCKSIFIKSFYENLSESEFTIFSLIFSKDLKCLCKRICKCWSLGCMLLARKLGHGQISHQKHLRKKWKLMGSLSSFLDDQVYVYKCIKWNTKS